MQLKESGEMYLETILLLQNKSSRVRAIDVAGELGYTKPSVSRAMSILKKAEYIYIEEDGSIKFTEKGRQKAESVLERHRVISSFLISIGVDKKTADNDACQIEHIISSTSIEAMKRHI